MNAEYERACDRFNAAGRAYREAVLEAERIIREADEEYVAANENLAKYEISPGIPKLEYREES
jgi:hypothetical protein